MFAMRFFVCLDTKHDSPGSGLVVVVVYFYTKYYEQMTSRYKSQLN